MLDFIWGHWYECHCEFGREYAPCQGDGLLSHGEVADDDHVWWSDILLDVKDHIGSRPSHVWAVKHIDGWAVKIDGRWFVGETLSELKETIAKLGK